MSELNKPYFSVLRRAEGDIVTFNGYTNLGEGQIKTNATITTYPRKFLSLAISAERWIYRDEGDLSEKLCSAHIVISPDRRIRYSIEQENNSFIQAQADLLRGIKVIEESTGKLDIHQQYTAADQTEFKDDLDPFAEYDAALSYPQVLKAIQKRQAAQLRNADLLYKRPLPSQRAAVIKQLLLMVDL